MTAGFTLHPGKAYLTRGAEQFSIMRDGVEVAEVPADQASFEDDGLTPGEHYTYTIKTSNATGESDSGFEVHLRTLPAIIHEPLHASKIGEKEGLISWPKVQGAEGSEGEWIDYKAPLTLSEEGITEIGI